MSELVKQNTELSNEGVSHFARYEINNLSPELTEPQKEIIVARNQITLREVLSKDEGKTLAILISAFKTALSVAGQKKEGKDYENQLNAYLDVVKRKIRIGEYQSLTPSELKIAVYRGASGSYGDFQGINAKSINGFVKNYLSEQNAATTKQRLYESKVKIEKEQEAKKNELKGKWQQPEYFNKLIEADKESKRKAFGVMVQDFGSAKCKRLIREGVIELTETDKQYFKSQTLVEYAKEMQAKRERNPRKIIGFKVTEESEKAAKNRIYYSLVYNFYLEE